MKRCVQLAIVLAFLPTIVFVTLRLTKLFSMELNQTFLILAGLTVFFQVWTGVLYFLNPVGKKTYESLKTNFQACACGEASIIALFNPDLSILLFIMSYIFVGFLFDLHANYKS